MDDRPPAETPSEHAPRVLRDADVFTTFSGNDLQAGSVLSVLQES